MISSEDFQRLYWISGSPCAGKTVVSTALAEQFNWNVYHCDDWEGNQREHADPKRHPIWSAYSQLNGDKLWLMPVEEHVIEAEKAYNEQFELILEDLAMLLRTDERPLLYDGYVSPRNLTPLLPSKAHVFYLVASEAFQVLHYKKRAWIRDILAKTSNPETAWDNWMKRDAMISRRLEKEVLAFEIPWLLVDGSITLKETVNQIAHHFIGA